MAKVDVNALLGTLLGNLGSGAITEESLKKASKKKKEPNLKDESTRTWKIHKPSMVTTRLVMLTHMYECKCGAIWENPNMHVLTEKKDKHGNLHLTRFVSGDDIAGAKREVEYEYFTVCACSHCFEKSEALVPVTDKDAQDSIKPVENKMTFDEIADILTEGASDVPSEDDYFDEDLEDAEGE